MKEKMKLAVFSTQPPHLYFGGVERRIVETAKLLKNEVEITIYSGTKRGFNKNTTINGATIVPCHSIDRLYPLDNWAFNRTISKMVNKIKADVYEAHAVSGYGFLDVLRRQKIRKPFIQTIHGVLADEYIHSSKSRSPSIKMKLSNFFMRHLGRVEKDVARKATLIVTVSNYSAQKIVELYGINESKIRIVPNGVDLQKFHPSEGCGKIKNLIGGNGENVVLFVGNLIPRKGLHFLIEAAKYVIREVGETKFVVVGNGPLRKHLISYSKEQGVSGNFIFFGDAPEDILPNLYNCSDVFASPSVQEGLGITLLEAQASAKPVVAFNVTAIPEVVKDKETGLLVKPDSHELADALSYLLSDKQLRERIGNAGREYVHKNFSWNSCAQKMRQIYNEALQLI